MMISQSEQAAIILAEEIFPMRLPRMVSRSVSRLEFRSLDALIPSAKAALEEEPSGDVETSEQETVALVGNADPDTGDVSMLIETARIETRAAADEEWEQKLNQGLGVEREKLTTVLKTFERERIHYFSAVESEVVKLALAIAAQVIHREIHLDPLLLAGVVRVALSQLAEGSSMTLHIPAADLEKWRESFPLDRNSTLQLVGEEGWTAGECRLDTDIGRVDLGISAQLEEIERGFFDLLKQRPA